MFALPSPCKYLVAGCQEVGEPDPPQPHGIQEASDQHHLSEGTCRSMLPAVYCTHPVVEVHLRRHSVFEAAQVRVSPRAAVVVPPQYSVGSWRACETCMFLTAPALHAGRVVCFMSCLPPSCLRSLFDPFFTALRLWSGGPVGTVPPASMPSHERDRR